MGLEGVEMIMAVETEFNLQIPDREAEQLVRVGQLYEYVLRRLELPMPPVPYPAAWDFLHHFLEATEKTEVAPDILAQLGLPRRFRRPLALHVVESLAADLLETGPSPAHAAWRSIRRIVREHLGVEAHYVTLEAEFVADLGLS